ncbi:MAG: HAMP domain-containing sensor histidine kinase [Verrucomicrobiota bacterium]
MIRFVRTMRLEVQLVHVIIISVMIPVAVYHVLEIQTTKARTKADAALYLTLAELASGTAGLASPFRYGRYHVLWSVADPAAPPFPWIEHQPGEGMALWGQPEGLWIQQTFSDGRVAMAAIDQEQLDAEIRRAMTPYYIFAGVLFLVGTVGGWLSARLSLQPLYDFTATAKRIGAGNFKEKIDVEHARYELKELGATFNAALDALQQSAERQTRSAADTAHELRTPLAVALSEVQLGLKKLDDKEEVRRVLETCERTLFHVRDLLNLLIDMARLDAEADELALELTRIDRIVRQVVELIHPMATNRKIDLIVQAGPVEAPIDRLRFKQVMTNLMENAIRYSPEGDRVEVEVKETGDEVVVAVRDNGPGIAPDDLPRIFDRFFRADKVRTDAMQGISGMGLSISRSIVNLHGGTIEVESESGAGACFRVRLPKGEKN